MFLVNHLLAYEKLKPYFLPEDSHETSSLIFVKRLKTKMSSAAIFVWRFKG